MCVNLFFLSAVQARDSGPRPLSGMATVLCSVLDENDNPPEFMQPMFQISLPENLSPGVIHAALASDPDHGENGTIHYSILGSKHTFQLDHKADNNTVLLVFMNKRSGFYCTICTYQRLN